MRLTALLLFVGAGVALAAEPANRDASKEDAVRLQGEWSIVSVELNGLSLPMSSLKDSRLSIQGTEYLFQLDRTRLELTFKVDASKEPRAIDLEVVNGPDKGKVYHGIYKLENGQYRICRSTVPGEERPTEFATRPNSGLMMVVWRHAERPAAETKTSSTPASKR